MPAVISFNCPGCAHDLVPTIKAILGKIGTIYNIKTKCPNCGRIMYLEVEWDMYVKNIKEKTNA